jgi:hypothetical protein
LRQVVEDAVGIAGAQMVEPQRRGQVDRQAVGRDVPNGAGSWGRC